MVTLIGQNTRPRAKLRCFALVVFASFVWGVPTAALGNSAASWVSEVQFASGFGLENEAFRTCCFDYTGDEIPDDALGTLISNLASLVPGVDVSVEANRAIVLDQLTLLIDWLDLPSADGDVSFGLVLGEHTEDTSGFSLSDFNALYAERLLGTEFAVLPESLGPEGPLLQFDGTRTGNLIEAGPSTFPFKLEVPLVGTLDVDLLDALLEIDLDTEGSNPPETLDVDTPNPCTTSPCDVFDHVDGMRIGGVVSMEDLAANLDELIVGERGTGGEILDPEGTCACAWGTQLNGSDSLIPSDFEISTRTIIFGTVRVPICTGELPNAGFPNPAPGFSCGGSDPAVCAFALTLCNNATIAFAGVPDVDLPGDPGVRDGISVGLYASFTGGNLRPGAHQRTPPGRLPAFAGLPASAFAEVRSLLKLPGRHGSPGRPFHGTIQLRFSLGERFCWVLSGRDGR